MTTKAKILEMARKLFNDQGLSAVSSRHVSDALEMSYGNLCYHFARKDDLILALYHAMQEEFDAEIAHLEAEIYRFDFMILSMRSMLAVAHKYRFIYLDFTLICRKFPSIRSHAQERYRLRILVCRAIYQFLIEQGHLKTEKHPGHYDLLVQNLLMILNGWIVDAEIFYSGSEEGKIDHYLGLIYRFFSSSLTKKGIEAFQQVYLQS